MLASDPKKVRWLGIDLRPRWRRRVAVSTTYLGFLILVEAVEVVVEVGDLSGHNQLAYLAMIAVTLLWYLISVFRPGGPVKSFHPPQYVRIDSLDGWARYRYGVAGFEDASEEQKTELLRKYRVGTFVALAGRSKDPLLDERERTERDHASRWALNWVAILLTIYAGMAASWKQVEPIELSGYLWMFCIMARTLPGARVLWTEPDPREAGELQLAEGGA